MNNFWNKRYNTEEFVYGETPNKFVKQELAKLKPGKILFPAEGEGRNAVYAATLGWQVAAFDLSTVGKKKAELLASKHHVQIEYKITDFTGADYPENYFDALILTYAHIPTETRIDAHKKLTSYLKPGGILVLEAFSKKQIDKNTGGPNNIDFLFSEAELKSDFSQFSELKITETDTILDEGSFHQGKASVIRVIGKK